MLLNYYLTYFQMKMVETAALVQNNKIENIRLRQGGNILNNLSEIIIREYLGFSFLILILWNRDMKESQISEYCKISKLFIKALH